MLDLFRRRRAAASSETEDNGSSAYTPGPPAPQRPQLPKPERINRNVLTIAAVVMGTLVLAAVVFMQPSRPSSADSRTQPATPPPLPDRTFLDQPIAIDTAAFGAQPSLGGQQPMMPPHGGAAGGVQNPYALSYPSESATDRREASYRAALEAPLFADGASRTSREPLAVVASAGEASENDSNTAATTAAAPRTGKANTTAAHTSVVSAPGPYAIQAGTLIPAVLLTGVDSDLPGEVLGQVARDVYDSRTMRSLLVPKGSKLLGKYEDRVTVGQNRLLIAWTRIIFPDGRSVTLHGLETKDRTGAGGLHDQVDRHTRQVFGTATLLSLISAGVQLSQPRGTLGPYGAYPSVEQVAAGAVGRELADVATQMLRRDIDIRPTIRIRQGMPFNVYLNSDLSFVEPYAAQQ
jgi:type IV secretory pathway VirB10-like protein